MRGHPHIAVEYNYSSLQTGFNSGVPEDAYIIIGDIAGNGSTASDQKLDAFDVAAFVAAKS